MAKTDPSGRRRRTRKPLSPASARILREWRGCDEPIDYREGLHQPSDFLHEILESAGAIEGLHEDKVREVWKDLAGDFIASHTEPVSVRNGELLLRVSQPTLRFQLDRMKPQLLSRIQSSLGNDTIRSIRFTHG